jgi:threonyl-tRNA synthetase
MSSEEKLQNIRHTLAHLTVAAVRELWPGSQNAIGPAIDNGFYQDFEIAGTITDADLPKIEEKMRELLPKWTYFEKKEVRKEDALKEFSWNKYKCELIEEFAGQGKKITFHNAPGLVDLCRGGHSENPAKDIDSNAFKLDRIAGAYWRGDEKKPMLTRIYGLAFENKRDLDAYIAMREEAKKRDHRKIAKEQDLLVFSELVGPGLPLWTPRGTTIRHELDSLVWRLRKKHGYQRVTIPHITKKELYETSGHWSKFSDELFRIQTREDKEYALKPMNCPHHTQIFARKPHSYREMPQRYAETTMVYRDEQSGELGGLTRVLSITQDDSHVFCRQNQIKDEFFKIWDIIDTFYTTFGFKMRVRLSFHDPKEMKKYLGTKEIWESSENVLREIAQERGADYFEESGEAAMYGPKLDFMAMDAIGREHQVATIQLDFNTPERFDLTCVNEKGEKERIVMIHCAVMGSIERFCAVLFEHLAGAFPTWLAPEQVRVLGVSEKHTKYAHEILQKLKEAGIRAEIDDSNETLGKRIRSVKLAKVPYFLVLGDDEMKAKTVMVESRDEGTFGAQKVEEVMARIQKEKEERSN